MRMHSLRLAAVALGLLLAVGCSRNAPPPPLVKLSYETFVLTQDGENEPVASQHIINNTQASLDELLKQTGELKSGDTAVSLRLAGIDGDQVRWLLNAPGGVQHEIALRPGESKDARLEGSPYTVRLKLNAVETSPGSGGTN